MRIYSIVMTILVIILASLLVMGIREQKEYQPSVFYKSESVKSVLINKNSTDTTYEIYNDKNTLLLKLNKNNTDSNSIKTLEKIYKTAE